MAALEGGRESSQEALEVVVEVVEGAAARRHGVARLSEAPPARKRF